jgi:hypothetical protein
MHSLYLVSVKLQCLYCFSSLYYCVLMIETKSILYIVSAVVMYTIFSIYIFHDKRFLAIYDKIFVLLQTMLVSICFLQIKNNIFLFIWHFRKKNILSTWKCKILALNLVEKIKNDPCLCYTAFYRNKPILTLDQKDLG